MRSACVSGGIGLTLAVVLALAATYTTSPVALSIVRPFAILGFVVVNRHQGSLLFSVAAMFVAFSIVAWLFIAVMNRVLHRQE